MTAKAVMVLGTTSGAGKSFMALDMAGAIARGLPWRGKKTKQGRVVYIAAEGAGGTLRGRARCECTPVQNGAEAPPGCAAAFASQKGALPRRHELARESANLGTAASRDWRNGKEAR